MANTQDIATRLLSDLQRDYNLTREQAAGVVGNLMHESGGFNSLQEIKPLVPGSRGGYGYAQWTGPRRNAFEDYAASNRLDPASYEANYGFLRHELANDPYERRQFNTVRNAQTAEEAARLISQNYLRPGIPHMDSRINYANQLMSGSQGAGLPIMSYAQQQQAASTPATRAIGNATAQNPRGMIGALASLIPQNMSLPHISPQLAGNIQSAIVGPMMGTVAGRTMIGKHLMGMNIGDAPSVSQGHSGSGTRAMAVSSGGAVPVTLTSRGGGSGGGGSFDVNSHMNMDVYRANAEVLGGGGFNQDSINDALARGETLYRLA